jgi:DHA1 family inner membrane transport protein
MSKPLLALAAAAFGVGTTEFVVMGLLPEMAIDLAVQLPDAGMIITAYAAGVVIGAPLAAIATNGMARRRALLGLALLFVLGNLACAIAPDYAWLIGARVLTAFCHAAFFGIAAIVAGDLAAPNRRGQAVALVFAGLTIANILGVPAGTALGQAMGWRTTFLAVAAIGGFAFAWLWLALPRTLTAVKADLGAELRSAMRPSVILAMTLTVLTSASLFAVFSFIAPILGEVTGLAPGAIAGALVLFGVGMTTGGFVGGHLADRRPQLALPATIAVLISVMAAFALSTANASGTLVLLFAWGMAVFALAPALQMQVIAAADGAPTLASTLNQAAFNLGNAAGAAMGAGGLAAGMHLAELPWVGVGLAILALIVALAPLLPKLARGVSWPVTETVNRRDLFDEGFQRN